MESENTPVIEKQKKSFLSGSWMLFYTAILSMVVLVGSWNILKEIEPPLPINSTPPQVIITLFVLSQLYLFVILPFVFAEKLSKRKTRATKIFFVPLLRVFGICALFMIFLISGLLGG